MSRSSIVTLRTAALAGAGCGTAGGGTPAFGVEAAASLTVLAVVGGGTRLPQVASSPSAITAMTRRMPSDRILSRYRRGEGESGSAVRSSYESELDGTASAAGNGSGERDERSI